jgi:hypothetical protein
VNVAEALELIREVGDVQIFGDKMKLRFPESERAALEPAIETLRNGKAEALKLFSDPPPIEQWPESLLDLADEVSVASGDAEGARRQVWLCWYEWKARMLNRLFLEQGVTGQAGRIMPETIRHGEWNVRRPSRATQQSEDPPRSI